MPPGKPRRNQPAKSSKFPWLWVAAVLVLGGGTLAYFLMERPAPAPVAPVATPTTPAAPAAPIPSVAPYTTKHIYSDTDPAADIAAGLARAKQEHKRVILDFGGDWCGDCQVLDFYFHQTPNADLLAQNFVLVHVWIGHEDANLDVAAKYGVPISRGVPALAVLAANGSVLYSQKTGEFKDMRHMDPTSVAEFLDKWKS